MKQKAVTISCLLVCLGLTALSPDNDCVKKCRPLPST